MLQDILVPISLDWTSIAANIHVTCKAIEDIQFNLSDGNELRFPSGSSISGVFKGIHEEGCIVILYEGYRLGFTKEYIFLQDLEAMQCFRCGTYHHSDEFKRSPLIVDKSPLLNEVCSTCYRRIKSKIAEHDSHARKHGGAYTLQASEWIAILKNSEGCCHYCQKFIGYDLLVVEHQQPISWKGANSKENVVSACIGCNSSKGDRDVETWHRALEARQLMEDLQAHLGLSKFEVTNKAIRTLAQIVGLIEMEAES